MAGRSLLAAAIIFCSIARSLAETTAEKQMGFHSSPCPDFQKGACQHKYCYASSTPGFQYKFQTIELELNEDGGPVAVSAQVPSGVKAPGKTPGTQSDCCWKCAQTAGCAYWQWIPAVKKHPCYLISAGISTKCQKATSSYSTALEKAAKRVYIGGKCNPKVSDDPHFEGAHGTHYDFNGEPDRSFCLISDHSVHVNIRLTGYLDNRTEGATVLRDGKAVRTWIKEIGVIWREAAAEHTLQLVARSGKKQTGGDLMSAIKVDGKAVPLPKVGATVSAPGDMTLKFEGLEKRGKFDVDFYTLRVGELMSLDLRLRVAQPALQTATEAEAHFNIGVNNIKRTDRIHGLLGQTYRPDHEQRAIDFSHVSAMLHAPIVADGESGKGFLDGLPRDYLSSSVLSHDCLFSAYETHASVASE